MAAKRHVYGVTTGSLVIRLLADLLQSVSVKKLVQLWRKLYWWRFVYGLLCATHFLISPMNCGWQRLQSLSCIWS